VRINLDLFYDNRKNVELYPQWQAFLREHQPKTIISNTSMSSTKRTSQSPRSTTSSCGAPERMRVGLPPQA
jgi:hypothetical protein